MRRKSGKEADMVYNFHIKEEKKSPKWKLTHKYLKYVHRWIFHYGLFFPLFCCFWQYSLTGRAYQTAGWTHLGWTSQLSVLPDSGTWWWGMSPLSRTDELKGPWVCRKTPSISCNHFITPIPAHLQLPFLKNYFKGKRFIVAKSANIKADVLC